MDSAIICPLCGGPLHSVEENIIQLHLHREVHINNVPAEKCKFCNHLIFVNRVSQQLTRIVKNAPPGISEVNYVIQGNLEYRTLED